MGLFYDSLTMALACNRSIFPTGDFNIDVIREHAFDDNRKIRMMTLIVLTSIRNKVINTLENSKQKIHELLNRINVPRWKMLLTK